MKQLLFAAALIAAVNVHAQSAKYTDAMKKNLEEFKGDTSQQHYEDLAASFQRIGDAEKTQWLPYYWAGMCLASEGWMYYPDQKGQTAIKSNDLSADMEKMAGRIKDMADKAEALATSDADKSEISLLRNMAATQQMLVDPQSRYMTYGAESGQYLQKAMTLNPNNPRAYYIKGMSLFGTPEQFGGGKAVAKPMFQKAVDLGKAEQHEPLHPNWGLDMSEAMLAACQ